MKWGASIGRSWTFLLHSITKESTPLKYDKKGVAVLVQLRFHKLFFLKINEQWKAMCSEGPQKISHLFVSQWRIRQSAELGIRSHIHCSHSTIFLPLLCLYLLSVKPDIRHWHQTSHTWRSASSYHPCIKTFCLHNQLDLETIPFSPIEFSNSKWKIKGPVDKFGAIGYVGELDGPNMPRWMIKSLATLSSAMFLQSSSNLLVLVFLSAFKSI